MGGGVNPEDMLNNISKDECRVTIVFVVVGALYQFYHKIRPRSS